jgi:hypothetical protein
LRPGATVLASTCSDADVVAVTAETPDGTGHVITAFNPGNAPVTLDIEGLGAEAVRVVFGPQTLQTLLLN